MSYEIYPTQDPLWTFNKKKVQAKLFQTCKYFVLNNSKDDLGKFDLRSDEGIFIGYSSTSKAYRIYNKRTYCVEKSFNVIFDESGNIIKGNTSNDGNDKLGNTLSVP